jgi:uracil-DNA glycosylase
MDRSRMSINDLLSEIDDARRCPGCTSEDRYCATYIGPLYVGAQVKVLFIGLDAGGDASDGLDLRQLQAAVLDYYKTHPWNQRYRGCIRIASHILGSKCLTRCASQCENRRDSDECALRLIAQGNAVSCVPSNAADMTFGNHTRIESCLPLMIEQIQALRPDAIVLLSAALRDHVSKRGPFFRQIEAQGGKLGRLEIVTWPDGWRSAVVAFNHPSHGHLDREWEREMLPDLEEVRRYLAGLEIEP